MLARMKTTLFVPMVLLFTTLSSFAQEVHQSSSSSLEGRWDMVITKSGKELPSWLEVRHSGNHTLVGRFVYAGGSARPVSEVKFKDGKFSFAIPMSSSSRKHLPGRS